MFKRIKRIWIGVAAAAMLLFGCLLGGCGKTGGQSGQQAVKEALELTVTQLELIVGESGDVNVKEPQEGVTYTFTSTSDAVSVDENGHIVAEKIGSGCVVVSTDKASGVCIVVVKDTKPVELNGISIENGASEMKVGDSLNLRYVKDPVNADDYNSIQWSSSNEYVASVDKSGVLTANKPGEAVITVKATGTEQSAQFTLFVSARQSVLSLNYDDATGVKGQNDLTLTVDLFTDYDEQEVEGFTSSNPTVATINAQGEVSFLAVGKTVISYAVTCGPDRLEATCKVAVVEKAGYAVIRTPEQLQDIGNTSGNYMLGNDIDMQEACSEGGALYHAGNGFAPLFNVKTAAFSGTFDGMGYSIKNLQIKRTDTAFVALFSYINVNEGKEGVICNLALEGGKIEGGNYVAAFVGSQNGSGSAAAGLKNCWTDIEIVSMGNSCGGLVAYNGGLIENCYSLSKISGSGTLSSVSHNTLANNAEIGVKGTYVCSDYQPNVTQLVNPANVRETVMEAAYKTLEEMKSAALYSAWDTDVWSIEEGRLPVLKTANDR